MAALCAALAVNLLCGCSQQSSASTDKTPGTSSATSGNAATETSVNKAVENDGTVSGIVTAVDGDTITIQVMDMMSGGGQMGGGKTQNGTVPAGMPEDVNIPTDLPGNSTAADLTEGTTEPAEETTAPADLPEGGNAGQPQQDGKEPGGGGMPQGNSGEGPSAPSGETITVTITSDTKISINENGTETDCPAENITVGSMISVTYGEDGETVLSITINQAPEQMQDTATAG